MTTQKPPRFEALYRVEKDGTQSWVLQLENNDVVTITDTEIRLYASMKDFSDKVGDPKGIISRKVEPDAISGEGKTDEQAETGDDEPKRLI